MGMREALAPFQGHQGFFRAILNFTMAGGPGLRHDMAKPRGRSGFMLAALCFLVPEH